MLLYRGSQLCAQSLRTFMNYRHEAAWLGLRPWEQWTNGTGCGWPVLPLVTTAGPVSEEFSASNMWGRHDRLVTADRSWWQVRFVFKVLLTSRPITETIKKKFQTSIERPSSVIVKSDLMSVWAQECGGPILQRQEVAKGTLGLKKLPRNAGFHYLKKPQNVKG